MLIHQQSFSSITEMIKKIKELLQLELFNEFGVADGARTHDNRNHNPGLYQLSYSHRREKRL